MELRKMKKAREREARKAAEEKAEIVEAMYKAALIRGELAGEREKAPPERDAALAAGRRPPPSGTPSRTPGTGPPSNGTHREHPGPGRGRARARRDRPARRASAAEETEEPELERARLEAELQRAHLDALTGALRREVGRLALRNEIERARRADGKFVIAFIDVDGLKGVNDRDGHAAGDRVLRMLAAIMRANLRPYDPIVRFGGDEFVCGIASIDTGEVQHRIGVMDQSLRNATGVGITAGLAQLTSNESVDELTERADAALIEAKHSREA